MVKKYKTAIVPTRKDDFSGWYQNVIKESELADNSPVRGCMVIRPWGYSLWENIIKILDPMFKSVGVENAYFPLFIPLSFMEKEAEHVDGFAKECAVVTHHRLIQSKNGSLKPDASLPEPLVVRPTSETIIGNSFSKWISSHRDLPLIINQWSNVVRWELRTRMFLRTSEFLWQEGHTAHINSSEAIKYTKIILDIYEKLATEYLAIPVIKGRKSAFERFPGATDTLCIEAMMQDKKSLQMGTSHFLGQNFSKTFNIKFQDKDKLEKCVWTTSWGVSTRLLGGVIMVHGDDNGLVIPPRIAPLHVVILPIFRSSMENDKLIKFVNILFQELSNIKYYGQKLKVKIDDQNTRSRGWKWVKKGVPIRVEVGPRDIDNKILHISRRDKEYGSKIIMNFKKFITNVSSILDEIHENIFYRAKNFRDKNLVSINSIEYFYDFFKRTCFDQKSELGGGFALSYWCGRKECEAKIKEDLLVTIRCILLNDGKDNVKGNCVNCGLIAKNKVIFAKSY